MSAEDDVQPNATISDVIDAVVLYDQPILDHRFAELVSRHPDVHSRERLLGIPFIVTRGARITRAAAFEWERVAPPVLVDDVVLHAERLLLQAFLDSAEAQIRLKASVARHAPTREVRDLLESAIDLHRDVTRDLRHALRALQDPPAAGADAAGAGGTPRCTQAEEDAGDLRGQVEGAIRRMRDGGKQPRLLTLSHVALRHLRDQGCFRDGETTLLGVPVTVDLAWDASEFALHSNEGVPLEEMVRATKEA